jgi:hypothetical protein
MKRQHVTVSLAAITLLGAALRAHQLGLRLLWLDEARIFWVAQGSLSQVIRENATWNSAPPLFPILVGLVARLADTELALRAISWAAGTLAIPAMYLLGRRFLSQPGALFGSLLLAVAVVQIKYSQEVREYSLSVLLLVLLVTSFLQFVERPTWKRGATLAAVATVGLLTQYSLALVTLALNGVMAVHLLRMKPGRKDLLAKWSAIQALLVLVALLVIQVSLRGQWEAGGFWGGRGQYLEEGYWAGPGAISAVAFAYRGTRGLVEYAFPGLGFALLVYCGTLAVLFLRRTTLLPFLVGLPFCVFIAAALLRLYPYLPARQDLILTPLIYLVAALGIDYLMRVDRKLIWVAVVLVQVFRLAANPTVAYFRAGEKSDLGIILRPLISLARPGEPVYVCQADDPVIAYYFQIRFPQFPLIERDLGAGPRDYLDQVDRLVGEHPRTWLLINHTCGESQAFLDYIGRRWGIDLIEERLPIRLFLVEPGSRAESARFSSPIRPRSRFGRASPRLILDHERERDPPGFHCVDDPGLGSIASGGVPLDRIGPAWAL